MAAVVDRARRALRRRLRRQLPGAARDPVPGGVDQGGAAPAPAADPPAAPRERATSRSRASRSRPASWSVPRWRCRTVCPRPSPTPTRFDPTRYLDPRNEDVQNPWNWIPFGAGRHRCVGANFAMMQLKAIFSVLLQDWDLRAGAAARDLPQRPLEDGRAARSSPASCATGGGSAARAEDRLMALRIVVDLDLCQGHGVCESEAPGVLRGRPGPQGRACSTAPPDESHRKSLELAVKYCPTHALSLVDD